MKKIFLLFFALIIFLLSCDKQPSDNINNITEESTQPVLTDSESPELQIDEINLAVENLFNGESERLSFDDIIKSISGNNLTAELVYDTRTDAKISMSVSTNDDAYYPVNSNIRSDIRISPLDTLIEILVDCEYIETNFLNEPVIYTFIFHASDMNRDTNQICVYVTRSCVKFAYNGIPDGKEYANIKVCDGYDFYINGIIPDENGQLATIW
ncbi:MAG: hypothetical protein FWF92_01380 [Oscillospiraceae bacterium]|nr:hypothetical protein [Oscillospiraceae bacterium]